MVQDYTVEILFQLEMKKIGQKNKNKNGRVAILPTGPLVRYYATTYSAQ